jgi:hypothetical protein
MQDVSFVPILFGLPAPLRKILAPRGTKRHCLSSSALNLETGAICPDRHAFSTTLPHLSPVRTKKQVPGTGSQVPGPGTRYLRPDPFLSCIMHSPRAGFRSVSQAFRLIALLPYCPIALPRPGYPEPGTRYRVPEWKAGSGSDKRTDDGSGESPSRPDDRLRLPESSLRDRPSFIGSPLSLIHALTYDRT